MWQQPEEEEENTIESIGIESNLMHDSHVLFSCDMLYSDGRI